MPNTNTVQQQSSSKEEKKETTVPELTKEQKKLAAGQSQMVQNAIKNPSKLVTEAKVDEIKARGSQFIDEDTGQVNASQGGYNASTVDQTATAQQPQETDAVTFESLKTQPDVEEHLNDVEAAQGTLSSDATVQGQFEKLMSQFEGGEVPAWAAGAIRNANAKMQARGLGASSMAGAAVTQAAMESALPIASQDANVHAQLEFQNLANRQQTELYKSQQTIAAMFTDQAAENVERQINAASKNQVTQFYASLHSQTEQFNTAQINAVKQFNAGEKNAAKKFNEELKNNREQFNAQNSLIIAQANAQWRQDIATLNTQAENEANMEAARAANNFTQSTLDTIWQRERDLMSFAWQSSENQLDRQLELVIAEKNIDAMEDAREDQEAADNRRGLGQIVGTIVGGLF